MHGPWRRALEVLRPGRLDRELLYAARVLRRSPGATLLSVATMAAGIGASAVLFTMISGVVLRPLPYPDSHELVRLFDVNPDAGIDRAGAASGNLDDWRRRAGVFQGVAGYYAMGRTVSDDTSVDVAITAQVGRDFFEVVKTPPLVGRTFTLEEIERSTFNSAAAPTGSDLVTVLSHGFWSERFAADPGVIGRTITIDRRPFRIVGVMPPHFALPDAGVRLWIPWGIAIGAPRDQHYLGALARLQPGVSLGQAAAAMNVLARDLGEAYPATNRGWGVALSPLSIELVGATASVLWVLFAAVGLLQVVACASVALLSLIRGLDRRDEVAVRVALGATAPRLLREFALESALLAAAGGAAGVALAAIGIRALPALMPDLPRLDEVALDGRVLGFIVAATVLSAFLSGLPQAWRGSRRASSSALLTAARRATSARDRHWLRDLIVVGQVGMAVVLMTGCGLLVRSFLHLRAVDHGFDASGVLVAPIFLDNQSYKGGEQVRGYYRLLFERLSALPGVTAVGGATTVPTSPLGPDFERPVWPAGQDNLPAARVAASVRMVTPGYFDVLQLKVADGRAIDDGDAPASPRVVMVSETLARRLWPGQRAVGRQLVIDYSTAGTYPYDVIGVVGDVRFRGPRSVPLAEIYLPHAQRSYLIMNVVIRAAGDPRTLVPAVRDALRAVDPQVPAHGLHSLESLIGVTYTRERQAMVALMAFAAAAVFLAALGVYGVVSQRVRERTREIGIRMAMGASIPRIVRWAAGSVFWLVAAGLAAGALVSRLAGGVLDAMLFGVVASDGLTSAVVIASLAGVAAMASLLPSWRASRVDPATVLRG